MNLTLKVWRQKNKEDKGRLESYKVTGISEHSSFLEMLDVLNEQLITEGKEPVAFDHDCREGICGMCSLYINGEAHGPDRKVTTCQLHMRMFNDGDTIYIEPWRSSAMPVIKDLMLTDHLLTEYSKREVLFQLTLLVILRTQTPCQFLK